MCVCVIHVVCVNSFAQDCHDRHAVLTVKKFVPFEYLFHACMSVTCVLLAE